MSADKSRVLNFLEIRFDYLSARNVLSNWRKVNGIKDEIDSFDDAQLRSLLDFLKSEFADAGRTIAGIEHLILNPDVNDKPAVAAASEAVEPAFEEPVLACETTSPVENAFVETAPADDNAVETAPADDGTVETASADDGAVETALAEDGAVETALADDGAVETAPADDGAVETAPAEDNASHEGENKKKKKNRK